MRGSLGFIPSDGTGEHSGCPAGRAKFPRDGSISAGGPSMLGRVRSMWGGSSLLSLNDPGEKHCGRVQPPGARKRHSASRSSLQPYRCANKLCASSANGIRCSAHTRSTSPRQDDRCRALYISDAEQSLRILSRDPSIVIDVSGLARAKSVRRCLPGKGQVPGVPRRDVASKLIGARQAELPRDGTPLACPSITERIHAGTRLLGGNEQERNMVCTIMRACVMAVDQRIRRSRRRTVCRQFVAILRHAQRRPT